MPQTFFEKHFQRATADKIDVAKAATYICSNPTELAKFYSDPVNYFKEADVSLTEADVQDVFDEVVRRVPPKRVETEDTEDREAEAFKTLAIAAAYKTFGAIPEIRAFEKEFEAQIKDVTQPQGGTENFTNVRSPGAPPGKIPAEPGRSGRNRTGSYRTTDDVDGTQTGFTYDVSPGSPSSEWGRKNPYAAVTGGAIKPTQMGIEYKPTDPDTAGTRTTRDLSPYLSHGPVGTAGGTSSIDTYQPTKPGDVRPSYSGVGPRPDIPTQSRPEGGVSKMLQKKNNLEFDLSRTVADSSFQSATYETVRGQKKQLHPSAVKYFGGVVEAIEAPSQSGHQTEHIRLEKGDAARLAGQPAYPDTDTRVTGGKTEEDEDDVRLEEAARLESESEEAARRGDADEAYSKREKAMKLRASLKKGTLYRNLKENSYVGTVR